MFNEQLPTLRSDFLIHWTGKDIQTNYKDLNDVQRDKYISRLRSTLKEDTNGLWMNKPKKLESTGGHDETLLTYGTLPMTCFTEIRLSDVYKHTKLYSCLGFGFNRKFVIERSGSPVQYVPGSDDYSGSEDSDIIGNIMKLTDKIRYMNPRYPENKSRLTPEQFNEIKYALYFNSSFMKKMSRTPNDYQYLDEAEWRIVYTKRRKDEGKLKATGMYNPQFKIPFKPKELKILIFPDPEVRKKSLTDSVILNWLGEPYKFPIMVTIEECLQF